MSRSFPYFSFLLLFPSPIAFFFSPSFPFRAHPSFESVLLYFCFSFATAYHILCGCYVMVPGKRGCAEGALEVCSLHPPTSYFYSRRLVRRSFANNTNGTALSIASWSWPSFQRSTWVTTWFRGDRKCVHVLS